ncbi:MAG: hypothetical protein MMC23_009291 [Stictis urceolatum]|nr:hypothetical protein [Stictis urceolata]
MVKSIVILGGSFSGLYIAHKLLKTTHKTYSDFKVTIITPSTHLFWNPASVRHILPSPHCFSDDQLFAPIAPGFERYPRGSFELVIGNAQGIDEDKNEVYVKPTGGGSMTFHYTALVVCTGSTYAGAPYWKAGETSFHEQVAALDEVRARVEKARDIVLGGGGPTGVEAAAELGQTFARKGEKNVTLVVSGKRTIDQQGVKEDVARQADKVLQGHKVKVVKGTRVEGAEEMEGGKTRVRLSGGETLECDLYIPCLGSRANTGFLPKHLLAENGDLKVTETLLAAGSTTRDIYGAGDCTGIETKQISHAQSQAEHLAANLDSMLRGKGLRPYVPKNRVELFVALGKGNGVAQFGNFKVPSMVVSWVKSKALLVDRTDGVATGTTKPMGGSL